MGASASVIQEYYKAVDYWADIAGNRDWKLSVLSVRMMWTWWTGFWK